MSQLAGKQIKILAYDLNATGLANLNAAKNGQNWTFTNVTSPEFQTSTTRTRPRLPRTAHKSFTSVPSGYKAVATTDQAGFEGQAITIVKEK